MLNVRRLSERNRWFGHLLAAEIAALVLGCAGSAPALAQCETAKLVASNAGDEDKFGLSMALDGHTLVVAAGGYPGDEDVGIAYVFRFDGAVWFEEGILTRDDPAPDDHFGGSVAISGDVVVVGAMYDDDNGEDSGSAYVFRYTGAQWVQEAKLLPDDGAAGDQFGRAVGISGNTIVVATGYDDDNGDRSGSAYVFRFDGSSWNQEAKLLASDGVARDYFSFDAAMWGNTALIGAVGDDDNGENSGSAYVFRFDGSQWVQEAKLLPSDGEEGDSFGWPVKMYGGLALVGALLDDENGERSGSAYIFRYDGTTWNEEAKLLPSDGEAQDHFVMDADIHGDTAVIGAHGDDDLGDWAGAAYVFRYDGAGWREDVKLLASDGGYWDSFGMGVAVGPECAVVGAPWDSPVGQYSGAAYVFDLDIPGCTADLDRDCHTDQGDLGVLLAAWGCTGDGCAGDLNHDGVTDQADLGILLADWGCGT